MDQLEYAVVQVWEEVLHIHPISMTADFFSTLQGSSLQAVHLVNMVNERVKPTTKFPVSKLFEVGFLQQKKKKEKSIRYLNCS